MHHQPALTRNRQQYLQPLGLRRDLKLQCLELHRDIGLHKFL